MLGWMDALTDLPAVGNVTIPALSKTDKVAYKGKSSTSGEYFVFDELYIVAEENVQSGTIQVAMGANAAYFKNDTEWEYVASNSIYQEVPLTLDEGANPSLYLSLSWAADAGAGKRYLGAEIPVVCELTNTADVPLLIGAYGKNISNGSTPNPWS